MRKRHGPLDFVTDRTINRIRLRQPARSTRIVASVGNGPGRIVLEEFSTWAAAVAWANHTFDFTIRTALPEPKLPSVKP